MQDLDLVDVTLLVTTELEQLGVDYVIVGLLASTLYGIPRSTVDAALVADLKPEQVGSLVNALKDAFYIDALSILAAIDARSSFNLIHLDTLFKVDVFIPKPRAFEQKQFEQATARVIAVSPQRTARVASAEDTILAKLEWFRLGGESSERQWRDVLGILKQAETVDVAYLRSQAEGLNVSDLLEQAIIEAERPG